MQLLFFIFHFLLLIFGIPGIFAWHFFDDVDLSVVVENKTEFDLNRRVIPLYKVIDREGKILYAA